MAKVSNQNLTRNVDYLNVAEKRDCEKMEWSVGSSKQRYDSSKCKLTDLDIDRDNLRHNGILLRLTDEIWFYIVEFISISDLNNLRFLRRFLSRRFRDIAYFSDDLLKELKKHRHILNDIFDVEKQHELLTTYFDSFFTERFSKRFSLTLCYYLLLYKPTEKFHCT